MNTDSKYYSIVAQYYNKDSLHFEKTAETPIIKQIRTSFRKTTDRYSFAKYLEIGIGIGLDLHFFANNNPNRKCYGIDVSDGMIQAAENRIEESKLNNVIIEKGTIEDIQTLFPTLKADMITVYFGALNTVAEPKKIESYLQQSLSDDGHMVLTFVNKWYMMYILKSLLKFRFSKAFNRMKSIWGGYAPKQSLETRCYSYKDIKKMFPKSKIIYKRGYSILYPAWYKYKTVKRFPKLSNFLWKFDRFLQKTPFWNWGEYSLYVFKKA